MLELLRCSIRQYAFLLELMILLRLYINCSNSVFVCVHSCIIAQGFAFIRYLLDLLNCCIKHFILVRLVVSDICFSSLLQGKECLYSIFFPPRAHHFRHVFIDAIPEAIFRTTGICFLTPFCIIIYSLLSLSHLSSFLFPLTSFSSLSWGSGCAYVCICYVRLGGLRIHSLIESF